MRITLAFGCSLILLACKPGGGTDDGSTGDPPGTSSTGSSGPGLTETGASDPTTGDPATTTGPTTMTTPGTTTMPMPTTDPATSDPVTTDPATSEPMTSEPMTSDPSTTTGGTNEPECEVDADCKLQSDCCVCDGVPKDEDPGMCDKQCIQPLCDEFGVEKAVCRFGVCEAERLSCDQAAVECDAPTPDCPDGTLPETTPTCWTGSCVPAALCDVVPDCTYCAEGSMCVQKSGKGFFPIVCEPIPPSCGGVSSCNCVADLVCIEPFGLCFQDGDTQVTCSCPTC